MPKITHTLFLIILFLTLQTVAKVGKSWVSLYNYEDGSPERPTDMVVDAEGNIYICGWTWSSATLYDFITLKYNSSGELLWSQSYNGPVDSEDQPEAIVLDNSGNVYVIGRSQTLTWGDIAIIKYSTDGDQLWIQYYDNTSTDGGYDIDIGENGMIYAVGFSNANMITLQYNPEGELQWASAYNGSDDGTDIGKSLVLDASSNVYITGFSRSVGGVGTNRDITTIKYNAEGVEQWVSNYDGPGNASDEGYEIALDEMNNIYVMGYSNSASYTPQFATIKYNSSGEEEWVNRFFNPETLGGSPNGLAVYNSENIYVTGSCGLGVSTVKINSVGDTVWVQHFGTGFADQTGTDIITDSDGNIYVTGWVREEGGMWNRDYGTLKYSSDGSLLWDIQYQGLGDERDDALNICLDNENKVIITGETNAGTTGYDIGTIKYTQSGTSNSGELIGDSFSGDELSIFPNPAKNWFKLSQRDLLGTSSKSKVQGATLEIYDMSGRKLNEKQIPPGSDDFEVDVSGLDEGVYFCRLIADDRSITKKLIIQR